MTTITVTSFTITFLVNQKYKLGVTTESISNPEIQTTKRKRRRLIRQLHLVCFVSSPSFIITQKTWNTNQISLYIIEQNYKQSNSSQVVRQVPATDQARVRFPAIAFFLFLFSTNTQHRLQKIVRNLPYQIELFITRSRIKLNTTLQTLLSSLQVLNHIFLHLHNCCLITTTITIIRSRKHSTDPFVMSPQITLCFISSTISHIHTHLMSSSNEVKIIRSTKLGCDILAKRISSTT